MNTHRLLTAALALGVLGLAGCSREHAHIHRQRAGQDSAATLVSAQDFRFVTSGIVAQVGQPVTLVLDNSGTVDHDLAAPEIEAKDVQVMSDGAHAGHGGASHAAAGMVHVVARPGQRGTLMFTPTRAGRYRFICTVAGHAAAGMTGTLIVEE